MGPDPIRISESPDETPDNSWKMNVAGGETYFNRRFIDKLCIAYIISWPINETVQ